MLFKLLGILVFKVIFDWGFIFNLSVCIFLVGIVILLIVIVFLLLLFFVYFIIIV